MTAYNNKLETVPAKCNWPDYLNTLIEKATFGEPRQFNQLLQNMSLLYNVSEFNLPFKTIILFTDQSFGISELDPMSLLRNWHDQYGFLATYFNQSHGHILDSYKRLPVTLGKFAFQRFDDQQDVNHILALHNIQIYYADAQCKKNTWIEVDNHFKYKIQLKCRYLSEKMAIYATFRKQQLHFFNQMAFYSQFNLFNHRQHFTNHPLENEQYLVSESDYQPIKAYENFGQLDTVYQLFINILHYLFGADKLMKIANKSTQNKIRRIQRGMNQVH